MHRLNCAHLLAQVPQFTEDRVEVVLLSQGDAAIFKGLAVALLAQHHQDFHVTTLVHGKVDEESAAQALDDLNTIAISKLGEARCRVLAVPALSTARSAILR